MRRRLRTSNRALSAVGLDSFVDIVMNVMGTLFFVIIYIALSANGLKGKITTPMLTPGVTQPVFFELRDKQVFKLDANDLIEKGVAAFRQCERQSGPAQKACEDRVREIGVGNEWYSVKVFPIRCPARPDPNEIGLSIVPRPEAAGESAGQFNAGSSTFSRELSGLDPRQQHVFFFVRDDSFALFHSVRSFVKGKGLMTGWMPLATGESITSGCGGVNSLFDPFGPQG